MSRYCFSGEDLGLIRPEVIELEEDYGIPGMDVLLFRMEAKQLKKKAKKKTLYYIQEHMIMRHVMKIIIRMIQISVLVCVVSLKNQGYSSRSFNEMLCQYALDTDADTVILPIWDICGFKKEEARINTPGTVSNKNWTWKLKDFKTFPDKVMKTKEWIEKSNR